MDYWDAPPAAPGAFSDAPGGPLRALYGLITRLGNYSPSEGLAFRRAVFRLMASCGAYMEL